MVTISESATWTPVTRVETTTVALGGDEINSPNLQFKQLVDRTKWLKDAIEGGGEPVVVVPAGAIQLFAGSSAPDGFLLCQGQDLAIADYADLFAVLGTTYGSGSPGITFRVPDLRTRVPVGVGTGFDLATTGGSATHTLTTDEMPSHGHTGVEHTHTITDPQHKHIGFEDQFFNAIDYVVTEFNSGSSGDGGETTGTAADAYGTNEASTGITINGTTAGVNNTGGGVAHNNMQPYIVLNYIIKT
ncbi:phage tail protein [Geminocystis sp. NIES-3709]|uniref:phage tail protein n=1 Tax=Geminocystis sp. NIES-3709 TaxID=1617448 RepID=UPI0005FC3BAE|nr:tail fiber protein [Geminocystis sp. NIES-3709]BAQ65535.1 microcystin dependent protein [Geminocystis sp. NIES-3709]